jgi:hypothetical protein
LHPLDDRRSFMKLSPPHSLSTRIAWSHYFFYPHAKLEVACPPLPRCASFCGAGTSSRADHPIWSLDDLELEPLGRG